MSIPMTLYYIPDPEKRGVQRRYSPSLGAAVLRALHKEVDPLMTVVGAEDAAVYLSERHGRAIILNGEVAALRVYEHASGRYYRKSDLDALTFQEAHSIDDGALQAFLALEEVPQGEGYEFPLFGPDAIFSLEESAPDPVRERIFSLLYHDFLETYPRDVPLKEDLAQSRIDQAWKNLSLMERVILVAAHIERTPEKETQRVLEITNDEYKLERRHAEDIMYGTIVTGQVPIVPGSTLATVRPKSNPQFLSPLEREIAEYFLNIVLEREQGRMKDIVEGGCLNRQEVQLLRAYYGEAVPLLRVALQLGIHYEAVRPILNAALAKIGKECGVEGIVNAASEEDASLFVLRGDFRVSARDFYMVVGEYSELTFRHEKPVEKAQKPTRSRIHIPVFGFTGEQIDAAAQYLSELQLTLLRMLYIEHRPPADGIAHIGYSSKYYAQRKAAERIVRQVAAGTYRIETPDTNSDPKKKGRAARHSLATKHHRQRAQKSEKGYEEESDEDEIVIRRKPQYTSPGAKKRREDLLARMKAYREERGYAHTEETPPPIEGGLYYSTQQWDTISALEIAIQKSIAQASALERLEGKQIPGAVAAIVDGHATISFLIRDACFGIAEAYALEVYRRATEGPVWPLSDNDLQKRKKPNPKDEKKMMIFPEEEVRAEFVADYETYALATQQGEAEDVTTRETALIGLYQRNLRLARGYIATVAWHLFLKDKATSNPNDWDGERWKHVPVWKDGWTYFVPGYRIRRVGQAVLLSETTAAHYLAEEKIEQDLRRRYLQVQYYAESARGILVTKYDPYITARVKRFEWTGIPFDDRIDLGKEGLLRASQKFDWSRDIGFATYADHWIKAMVMREWKKGSGTFEIPSYMWDKIFKIQKEIYDIKKSDPDISDEDLYTLVSERTGMRLQTIHAALRAVQERSNGISLDDNIYDKGKGGKEKKVHEQVADEDALDPDLEAIAQNEAEKVRNALAELSSRQRHVLQRRYVGDDGEGLTLSKVGKEMGLSRERIRQIESKGLTRLREILSGLPRGSSEGDEETSQSYGKKTSIPIQYSRDDVLLLTARLEGEGFFEQRGVVVPVTAEMEQIVKGLHESHRAVLVEKYCRKKSIEEIAQERGIHVSSARSMFSEGRRNISQTLQSRKAEPQVPVVDISFEADIPAVYGGIPYAADEETFNRFSPTSKQIIAGYYSHGKSLHQIKAETGEDPVHMIRLIKRVGELLPKK